MSVEKNHDIKPLISVRNLTKSFGKLTVLDSISTDIYTGEKVVIIGPSGGGKSTFLRCLNCLEDPSSGAVIFDGVDIADVRVNINHHRQNMGMVFQQFNLFNNLTVLENITLAPEKIRWKKAKAEGKTREQFKADVRENALSLLRRVGLEDKADAYPSTLSGGQKQRIAIAGVLALNPKVLVLDESTAMLDPQGRKEVLSVVEKLNKEQGVTLVNVTHYMDEVVRADKVIVVNDGQIAMSGTPQEIFRRKDELNECGLELPLASVLASELISRGLPLPEGILTEERLAEELCALKSKI